MQAPQAAVNGVKIDQAKSAQANAANVRAAQQQVSSCFNVAGEEAAANASLAAWRKAQAGDEAGSMAILDKLDKQYPNLGTVQFMRGQCLEKLGKPKEAVKYFQKSVDQNTSSSMHLFKLAEAKRTAGDAKGAVADYRRLIAMAPNFSPAKLGLAQALIAVDKNSPEAKTIVNDVLAANPDDKDAQVLLSSFKNK
jgi:predicted Zn-dependent protease